ncbi:hypothetical protein SAMN05421505_11585 [Sinosporangium album]|uniref:Uncharacterized protein n=1 Tax=Sinosporangium album TaxID=504805 RepID=A0A1G8C744_9ACTN|nr:hypothetical protein SAMN05421505_11585 [Sinosporangium album]
MPATRGPNPARQWYGGHHECDYPDLALITLVRMKGYVLNRRGDITGESADPMW